MGEFLDEYLTSVRRNWKSATLVTAVGILFACMNLPKLLSGFLKPSIQQPEMQSLVLWPIVSTQASLVHLQNPSPEISLTALMKMNFFLLFFFVMAVIARTLRHKDAQLLLFAIGGLSAGFFGAQIISWLILIAGMILHWVNVFWHWITAGLGWLLSTLLEHWKLLVPLACVILLFWLLPRIRELLASSQIVKPLLLILAIVAVGLIAIPIVHWLTPYVTLVKEFLAPFFHLVGKILAWAFTAIVGILLTLLAFNLLGRLVVDQIRAAWNAGRGRKELALAGFGLGSALALVILISVGNSRLTLGIDEGWKASLAGVDRLYGGNLASRSLEWAEPTRIFLIAMPRSVKSFVVGYFDDASAPLVDCLLLMAALLIADVSVLASFFSTLHPSVTSFHSYFLPKEYFALFGFFLLGILIVLLQGSSESNSS